MGQVGSDDLSSPAGNSDSQKIPHTFMFYVSYLGRVLPLRKHDVVLSQPAGLEAGLHSARASAHLALGAHVARIKLTSAIAAA